METHKKHDYYCDERLIVEKMHPEGYMLLNGHHRWAAAVTLGYKTIPIKIVNLTHKTDVEQMLSNAHHTRRVAMDLDEVVFCADDSTPAERPLPFPLNHFYRERLRLGIPALFRVLHQQGYDIWGYSSRLISMDDVARLFKWHRAPLDGIITGVRVKGKTASEDKKQMEHLITGHYSTTIHIDSSMVLRIWPSSRKFEEHPVDCAPAE